jgi:hypothetical protein
MQRFNRPPGTVELFPDGRRLAGIRKCGRARTPRHFAPQREPLARRVGCDGPQSCRPDMFTRQVGGTASSERKSPLLSRASAAVSHGPPLRLRAQRARVARAADLTCMHAVAVRFVIRSVIRFVIWFTRSTLRSGHPPAYPVRSAVGPAAGVRRAASGTTHTSPGPETDTPCRT